MANFPTFDRPQKSMLSSILEGYEGFNRPMNMMQEQQQRRLANEQEQIKNQFMPKRLEQEQEQMRLANIFNQAREPYAEKLAQNEVGLGQAQLQNMNIGELGKMIRDVDNVVKQHGFNSPEAEMARQWFKNKVQRQEADHRTPEQKIADDLSGGDPEKRQQLLKQMSDVYLPGEEEKEAVESFKNEVPGARPMASMGKGERNEAFKKMQKEQERVNKVREAKNTVDAMRDLQEKYPKLGEAFSNAIKTEDPTKWEQIYRKLPGWFGGLNQEELTAVQEFRKLSSNLVLHQADIIGGKSTDALRHIISLSKPSATNTAKANEYLFNKLDEEYEPLIMYGNDVDKAMDLNVYIPQNLSKYKKEYQNIKKAEQNKPTLAKSLEKSQQSGKTRKAEWEGIEIDVPEELWKEFQRDLKKKEEESKRG